MHISSGQSVSNVFVTSTYMCSHTGYGTLVDVSGGTYCGYWIFGKRHGLGIMKYADGSSYEGEWEEDDMHGRGKFTTGNIVLLFFLYYYLQILLHHSLRRGIN